MDSGTQASPSKKAVYLSAQKVSIVAVVSFLFLLFGAIVVFANKYGEGSPTPSPSGQPDGLFQAGEAGAFQAKPQQQVKGAQDQAANYNMPQPEKSVPPIPKPSASAKSSPTSAPTTAPAPSPSPSDSPTPAPTSNNSDSAPSISDVALEKMEDGKYKLKWKTNEDTDELVLYWKVSDENDKKIAVDSSGKKSDHAVEISGMSADTEYKFKITAKNNNNKSTTEEKQLKSPM